MISIVQPLSIGNAMRVYLQPPAGATQWRLLRRDSDSFAGPDDAGAMLVYQGDDKAITDTAALYNGLPVFYRAYYRVGTGWIASETKSGTPGADFSDYSVDPLTLVRDRLELGLQVYIDRGTLSHVMGRIPVMTASPLLEETPTPVVTVHLASDASQVRAIGEHIAADEYDATADRWHSMDAWLSRWQLTIVGWCLNADERIELRRAMKTVLMGNLSVFDAAGMVAIDMQFSDTEDFVSYAAPVYMTTVNLTCFAPSMTDSTDPSIHDITVSIGESQ